VTGSLPREQAARTLLGLGEQSLVLASASPRRADLLTGLGLTFSVCPANVDETAPMGDPGLAAAYVAEKKARTAARSGGSSLVIGADTVVVSGNQVLGKPEDRDHARRMLGDLSGRSHEVITGLAVLREADGTVTAGAERTRVGFRVLTVADIDALVDSGEADDKAGAYGIQSLASLVVDRVNGDYFNVVGLPLGLLGRLIREMSGHGGRV